jgi:uncharacterized SAM-binding protein YcdF (DUF218 family)
VRRAIVWVLLGVIGAGVAAYVGRQALLSAIGGFLIVQDDASPSEAIVVLSGSLPDRILEAVDLYQAHLAPRIILTRERPLPGLAELRARGATLPEHHEQNISIAEQLGVPAAAIAVMPTAASSTLAEIRALVVYLKEQRVHSILLVTSKAHARRARLTFRTLAGPELRIAVCPSRYDPFSAADWWHERAFVRRLVIEYGKLLNFVVIDRWLPGNPTAGSPKPEA